MGKPRGQRGQRSRAVSRWLARTDNARSCPRPISNVSELSARPYTWPAPTEREEPPLALGKVTCFGTTRCRPAAPSVGFWAGAAALCAGESRTAARAGGRSLRPRMPQQPSQSPAWGTLSLASLAPLPSRKRLAIPSSTRTRPCARGFHGASRRQKTPETSAVMCKRVPALGAGGPMQFSLLCPRNAEGGPRGGVG